MYYVDDSKDLVQIYKVENICTERLQYTVPAHTITKIERKIKLDLKFTEVNYPVKKDITIPTETRKAICITINTMGAYNTDVLVTHVLQEYPIDDTPESVKDLNNLLLDATDKGKLFWSDLVKLREKYPTKFDEPVNIIDKQTGLTIFHH